VPEGSVFGFIGVNGAGKTTTMKMALGLLPADSGEIFVCDEKVRYGMTATNRHIGYLADVPEFYHYMRPKEYLRFCGELAGLTPSQIKERSQRLLELVGLSKANKKIGGFSRGMKQRLGVAQALINEPKLLICDEPTSALDPIGRKEILDILKLISKETTVIFSTHILADVEWICDRAAVLHNGEIVLEGTLSELKSRQTSNKIVVQFETESELNHFKDLLPAGLLWEPGIQDHEIILKSDRVKETQKEIFKSLAENELLPTKFEIMEPNIENLFLEVVQ
jgi:ABC-2 type transport system ATP-binding protein